MKILVIIPAKMDSKRLPEKNLKQIDGKSLLELSVDYAKQSRFNPDIFVSSENENVQKECKRLNVNFLKRPLSLCGDVEVVEVYFDVIKQLRTYDLVVALQPDNPNRSNTLDECIDYMIKNNYDDLFTVNPDYKRSGSVRIFKWEYLFEKMVSKRVGCILDSAVDIHTHEDLELVKNKMVENG